MKNIHRGLLLWRATRTACYASSNSRNICTTHITSLQSSSSDKDSTERTIHVNAQSPNINTTTNAHSSSQDTGTQSASSNRSHTTFSEEEVAKFRSLAGEWWKPDGDFKALHSMNKLRVALVREGLQETGSADAAYKDGPRPLEGVRVLDVGCGGGILAEPLARLGAKVTGLDAAEEGIEAAKVHASRSPKLSSNLNYICGRIEDHVAELDRPYDAIVASEVLEHVSSLECFLDHCSAGIRENGSLFVTTINRTALSYLGAILAAEYVLRFVPQGTHDWSKFVPHQDLQKILQERGFRIQLVHGMQYCPPTDSWCWTRDPSINYALHAVRTPQAV